MRDIEVVRWLPTGNEQVSRWTLLTLVRDIASIGLSLYGTGRFVSLAELNSVLLQGSGDDGWIGMTWTPFEVDRAEYESLKAAYLEAFMK